MQDILKRPISLGELEEALKGMDVNKAPGPDGVITGFFKFFWDIIKEDYFKMLSEAIQSSIMPLRLTRGLISLLHKGGGRGKLSNWRPITLLNVAYKIYAKALQLRLQPVLMEIISFNQSALLPMRFLLDNILLTHETLDWALHSGQPVIFLKLDFSIAYDMVDLGFLFRVMATMGFPAEFTSVVELLFQDAQAVVKVNGAHSPSFQIHRRVCQGCPLAPYLFLVLNSMVKHGMWEGIIKGITLPIKNKQQVMAQFADDTSMTLRREELLVRGAIYTLDIFCLGSGLVMNWDKSCGY